MVALFLWPFKAWAVWPLGFLYRNFLNNKNQKQGWQRIKELWACFKFVCVKIALYLGRQT